MVGTDWAAYLQTRESESLGAVVLDSDFRILAATPSVAEQGGYAPEDLITKSALELVHPDDLERAAVALGEIYSEDDERGEGLYRLALNGGGYRPLGLQMRFVDGHEDVLVMEFNEPTPTLQAYELAEDMVRSIRILSGDFSVESALDSVKVMAERQVPGITIAVTVFSSTGDETTWATAALPDSVIAENDGAHPLSLPDHVCAAFDRFDRNNWLLHRRVAYRDPRMPERIVFALVDDDDDLVGYAQILRPHTTEPDESEWLVYGSVSQILQAALLRHRLNEALRFAADHDPLTGLLNRRGLFDRVGQCRHSHAGLLVIDLDDFSWINNTLGHAAGDAALIAVAERLRRVCPSVAKIARFGGDEFVIEIDDMMDSLELLALADRIRAELVMPLGSGDRRRTIRASIGAVITEPAEDFDQAVSRADMAMYAAKRRGGDRVEAK